MRNGLLFSAALLGALCTLSSSATADTVLFQDNFTRPADSVNDLQSTDWVLTRLDTIPDVIGPPPSNFNSDVEIRTGTVSIQGTQTGPLTQRVFFNSTGTVSGAPVYFNFNDMASVYHTFNLDTQQQYNASFKYALHHLSTYSLAGDGLTASQVNGGTFIIPRAQGNDFPNNFGWQLRRLDLAPNSPLAIAAYSGVGRAGSPANIPFGTVLTNLPFVLQVDTEYRFNVAVNGDVASLYINGKLFDLDRPIGANFNNGTEDHFMFGYNSMGTAQRRGQFSFDDVVVTAPSAVPAGVPVTWSNTPNGTWDTSSTNWASSRGDFKYHENDDVIFSDASGGNFTVNLNSTVNPASVSVTTNGSYTLQGTGTIASGSLTKSGTGTLTILTNNVNDFVAGTISATTTINAGTLQVGNGGTSGQLGGGDITNNGTLIFNRSNGSVVTNAIGGTGAVQNNGTGTTTLAANSTFSGGLTVNGGMVSLLSGSSAGTGTITANSNTTVGFFNATFANAVVANNATLSAIGIGDAVITGGLNVTGNVTVRTVDAKNLGGTSRNLILPDTGQALTGTGNITVINTTANTNTDGSQGLRLRSTSASNFSGTITANQGAKLELQTTTSTGTFSPAGTGKIVLTGGNTTGTNNTNGNYSELTLRNNTTGNVAMGNNVEVAGTGVVILNPVTDTNLAPAGSIITLGNLRIGAGQEVATHKSTTASTPQTVEFQSVTLTSDGARFAAKRPAFSGVSSDAGDLLLGPIGLAPGVTQAGIVIAGGGGLFTQPRAVVLTGSNTYDGTTNVASGILRLAASDRIPDTSNMILGGVSTPTRPVVFDTNGFSEQLGSLKVNATDLTTMISLGPATAEPSNLRFGASAQLEWTGINTLQITSYEPGVDHIFFGSTNTGPNRGLSVSQLRRITIDNQEVNLAANGELIVAPAPAPLTKGDLNQDTLVKPDDILPMLKALANPTTFAAANNFYFSDVAYTGDVNNDGFFNNRDIQSLLDYLASQNLGSIAPVPEPTALALFAGGGVIVASRYRRRRTAACDVKI